LCNIKPTIYNPEISESNNNETDDSKGYNEPNCKESINPEISESNSKEAVNPKYSKPNIKKTINPRISNESNGIEIINRENSESNCKKIFKPELSDVFNSKEIINPGIIKQCDVDELSRSPHHLPLEKVLIFFNEFHLRKKYSPDHFKNLLNSRTSKKLQTFYSQVIIICFRAFSGS